MRVGIEELLPSRSLAACALVALLSLTLRGNNGDSAASIGPPPRDKPSGTILAEVESRLKLVKPSSAGVPSQEFLRASYAIINIFDAIPGMGMVKSDMIGNADKIWRHQKKGEPKSLEQMCDAELMLVSADKARNIDGSVCTSLLWLKRALRLIEGILLELVKDSLKPMKECCQAAYSRSLKSHHNMVMRSTFSVASNAAPARGVVLMKLAGPKSIEANTLGTIGKLLPTFTKLLDRIEKYLVASRLER